MQSVDLILVIPCFNEEESIPVLHHELTKTLENTKLSYEIVFIDDGSSDNTFQIIKELSQKSDRVNGISLSRNFGHQNALLAGLSHAKGNAVISMDSDMQHPPELIPELIEKYKQGYDIVNTRRVDTKKISVGKNTSSKLFYWLINLLSDTNIEKNSSDFRLMSRKALDAFLELNEKDRFNRGLVSWIGFKQTVVEYSAPERMAGKSKYTIRKMLHLALNGITAFSSKPLRISFYAGLLTFTFGFVYAIYALIMHITGNTIPGWTSILVSVLLIGGVQLLSIGIIGEYIARIFNESKNRPHYFVQQYSGNLDKED